jgi:predicted DNA-binding protein
MGKTKTLHMRTTEETYETIQNFARLYGKSVTDYIRDAILDKIEEEEDCLAIKEFERQEATGEIKYYSAEEVAKDLGIDI